MNTRKTIQYLTYYIIPGLVFLYIMYSLITGKYIYEQVVGYGSIALNLLILLVFVKPISVIVSTFSKTRILQVAISYRREFGVLAFWFAIFHGITLMYYLEVFTIEPFKVLEGPLASTAITGFISVIGMVILGLTSNRLSVMKLRGNWKKLHYIVYPTLIFSLIHMAQAEEEVGPYFIIVVFLALKIAEIVIVRRKRKATKTT